MIYQRLAKVFLICSDEEQMVVEIVVLAKARTHYPGQRWFCEVEPPMSTGSYYVYILASRHHGTIYIGITNDIRARLELHRSGRGSKLSRNTKSSASFMSKRSRHHRKRSHAKSS